MAIRNWKDIPLFKDVTDEQWNDWHWQVEHRLSTVEEIAQVINLSEQEKADIEKVIGGFRVGITPYYASLMDPDDPRDPVRMQAVPTLAEMHRSPADDLDPLHEDADSPAPGLTHRYPDRVLFLITDQCSMYCRHCTRRRLAGETDGARSREDIDACIEYIRNTFGLAMTPDKTAVMGLSMGGFGALHTALMFPETFGVCTALSSALIHNEVANMKPGEGNPVANYEYYRECFGDPEKLHESDNNPEVLAKKLKAEGKKTPKIFMACGTEDFLLEPNRAFHKFLTDTGIEHVYEESEGIHDMRFWSKYSEIFLPQMFA